MKNEERNKTAPEGETEEKRPEPTPAEIRLSKERERLEYYERKKAMREFEKKNRKQIVLFRAQNNFFVAIGNSAAYLANYVGPGLKMRPALKVDTDFKFKSKIGKVSIQNVDAYVEKMADSKFTKLVARDENKIVFALKDEMTDTMFETIMNRKEIKEKELRDSIQKSFPMPHSTQMFDLLFKQVWHLYEKKANAVQRQGLLDYLMKKFVEAHRAFVRVSREDVEPVEGIKEVGRLLEEVSISVLEAELVGIWKVEDALAVEIALAKLQVELKVEVPLAVEFKKKKALAAEKLKKK